MTFRDCKSYVVKLLAYGTLFSRLITTDATITWTLPLPQRGPLQTSDTSVRTTIQQVINSSSEAHLKWDFTLSEETLDRVRFLRGFTRIGVKPSSGVVSIDAVLNFQEHFDISARDSATLIIYNVTEADEAVFACNVETNVKAWTDKIQIKIVVPVNLTNVSGDKTVHEGSNVTLFCKATGRPTPNITWTRVLQDGSSGKVLHQEPTWDFPNISRTASGTYRCTADNGFRDPVSQELKVNVTYPAKIVKLTSEHEVAAQQRKSLDCQAEGNPKPTYTWTPCDPQQSVCHEGVLIFQASNKSVYTFTCKAANDLGSDTRNTTLFIAGDVINVTLVIMGEECTGEEYNQLWEKLSKTMDEIFAGKLGYQSVQQKNIRCGSVIVDLTLKFNSSVRESEVLSILRAAAKNGRFGDFNVSAITGTRYPRIATTMATTPTSSSDSNTGVIVGAVLGACAGVGVAVGAGVGARHVYKKRKCKKRDTKVHNNGSQEEAGGDVQGEGYVEVNRGYEGGTNRHSGGANPSQVPPVLYDTAQTGNRGAVKKPPVAQYAVVDKSKKKPKKPKPGELQYAELGEFSIGQGGPRSSTSPTNRPTETQYADVNAM